MLPRGVSEARGCANGALSRLLSRSGLFALLRRSWSEKGVRHNYKMENPSGSGPPRKSSLWRARAAVPCEVRESAGRAARTRDLSRAASGIGMGLTGYVSGAQSHTTINCVAPLDGSGAGSLRERLGLYIFKMSSRMSSYHTAHTSVLERVGPSRRPALSYYRPRLTFRVSITCVTHSSTLTLGDRKANSSSLQPLGDLLPSS